MALLGATGVSLPDSSLVFSLRTVIVSLGRRNVDRRCSRACVPRSGRRASSRSRLSVRERRSRSRASPGTQSLDVGRRLRRSPSGCSPTAMLAHNIDIKVRLFSLVAGVLLLFVGVAMVAARVVRPLAFVVGSPGARFGGVAGRLARQNAVRNPSRTASTAAAVMIGLALITFVAVIGQGVRSSFSSSVDQLFLGDYAISGDGEQPLTSKVALAVAEGAGRHGRLGGPSRATAGSARRRSWSRASTGTCRRRSTSRGRTAPTRCLRSSVATARSSTTGTRRITRSTSARRSP